MRLPPFRATSSLIALVTALAAEPVAAQSFNGTPTVEAGTVAIDRTVVGQDTLTVGSSTAIVRWDATTSSGTYNFQPVGTTATYVNDPTTTADFTILNRIIPTTTVPVQFNGTVLSRLRTTPSGPLNPGGSVWFYSPGGIVVGSSAVFDVGKLLLTTADPSVSNTINPLSIGGSSTSGRAITIQPGAAITAGQPGSYVAIVAPSVTQSGTINVNGSAAYVAAEQATLTIVGSLFNVTVGLGSTGDGTPLEHAGTTRWLGTTGQRIYMVSVPRTTLTELVLQPTADLGFASATAAQAVGNRIILSAGRNVADTSGTTTFATNPVNTVQANLRINGGGFKGDVFGTATTSVIAASTTSLPSFAGNVTLNSALISFGAQQPGATMTIGGNLAMSVSDIKDFDTSTPSAQINAQASNLTFFANNTATVAVAGNVTMSADATPAGNTALGTTGTSIGGNASMQAIGGTITIGGNATVTARAIGRSSAAANLGGSTGTGGFATITAQTGGTVTIGGSAVATAAATGNYSNRTTGAGVNGGAGTGGTARIYAFSNSSLTINGDASISGAGTGGVTFNGVGATAGAGVGGTATLASETSSTVGVAGTVTIDATGNGGAASIAGQSGGAGTGGHARVQALDGSNLTVSGASAQILASGFGGIGLGVGSAGGVGIGGAPADPDDGPFNKGAYVVTQGDGQVTLPAATSIFALGTGGSAQTGGNGFGGLANVVAFSGSIDFAGTGMTELTVAGRGRAGQLGGNGGSGVGGNVIVSAATPGNGATIGGSITMGDVLANAGAVGWTGGASTGTSGGGRGGDATAGNVTFIAHAGYGSLTAGNVTIGVDSTAGAGGTSSSAAPGGAGGNATGGSGINVGTISGFTSAATTGSATFGDISIVGNVAAGAGGNNTGGGTGGAGGTAIGGFVGLLSRGAPVTAGDVLLTANARGGAGGSGAAAGAGGRAEAGATSILATERVGTTARGSIIAGDVTAVATPSIANGGTGAGSSTGGAIANGGTTVWGDLDLAATNADITFASYAASTSGAISPGAFSSDLRVTNGTLGVAGQLSIFTPGDIGVLVGANGLIAADLVSLSAGQAIGLGEGQTQPAVPGTVVANAINLSAQGPITLGTDILSAADIFLQGTSLTVRNVSAPNGTLELVATGDIGADTLTAGGAIAATSTAGNITTGTITSGGDVDITGVGVSAAGITAGGSITVLGDTATLGALSASLVNPVADPANRRGIYVQGRTVSVASASAVGDIGLTGAIIDQSSGAILARGSVTSGAITSSGSIALTGASITTTGAIAAGGLGQIVYVGAPDVIPTLGQSVDTLNPRLLIGRTPTQFATGPVTLGGPVSGGEIVIASSGDLTAGALNAASRLAIFANNAALSGAAIGNTIDVSAAGSFMAGPLTASTRLAVTAANATLTGPAVGDTITLTTSGALDTDALTAAAGLAVTAGSAALRGAATGGSVAITTSGNLAAGALAASSGLIVNAGSATLSGTATGSTIDIAVVGDLTAAALSAGSRLTVTAGGITLGGAAIGGTIAIAASRALVTDAITATSALTLTGSSVDLRGPIGGSTVAITSSGTVTTAAVTAGNRLSIIAGTATFNGAATGATIDVTSRDIAIGTNGALGSAGTGTLTLNAQGQAVTVGGAAGAGGYQLDQAEIATLRANRIVIGTTDQGANLTLRAFRIGGNAGTGAGLNGANAALVVNAGGNVRVEGAVRYENAGASDSFSLNAGNRIDVIADQGGSIGMLGSSGAPAGTLRLSALSILAGDNALVTRLATDPTFAGRDAALAAPAATARPEGYFQASGITLTARDAVLIQNSNTRAVPGGFTVGPQGLAISRPANATAPVDVIISGRVAGSGSAFDQGAAVRPAVTVNGVQLTATSSINACLFAAASCDPVITDTVDVPGAVAASLQAVTDGPLSNDAAGATLPSVRLSSVIDVSSFFTAPLIQEPVTGSGNSSLWDTGFDGTVTMLPSVETPPSAKKERR